jgi:hypothetical protein
MTSKLYTNQPMTITAPSTASFIAGADSEIAYSGIVYNIKALSELAIGDNIEVDFSVSEKGIRRLLCAKKSGVVFFTIGETGRPKNGSAPAKRIEPKKEEIKKEEKPVSEEAKPEEKKIVSPDLMQMMKGYYIDQEMRLAFTTAKKMSSANPAKAIKLMMMGPSGYGKTTLPWLFSQVCSMDFYRMNCATVRDPEEWFGYREAKAGSTHFVRSEFIKLIEQGNLVVVLDEFNNTLFPLLDDDGKTVVHDEQFVIGPNVIVVATINSGYKFTGTFELDEALLNRFDFVVEVGAMPKVEETKVLMNRTRIERETAKQIVNAATDLRQMDIVCSTRTTLLIARMFSSGLSLREAFESAVVRRIGRDDASGVERKKVIDLLNVQFGVLSEREVEDDVFDLNPKPKKEEPKVEAAPEPESGMFNAYRLNLAKGAGEPNRLYAAQALRIANSVMTMKQSLEAIDLVLANKNVEVLCAEDKISETISKLKSAGFTGTYKLHRVSSWVPVFISL